MTFGIILDILILAVFLIVVVRTAKKGFAYSLFRILALIGAFVLASLAAKYLPEIIYNAFFRQAVSEKVSSAVSEFSASTTANAEDILINKFPLIYNFSNLVSGGADTSAAIDSYAGNAAENIAENVIAPLVTKLLSMFVYILALVISLPILRLIAKKLAGLFDIPVVGKVNTFLGAILGIIKGLFIVLLISFAITVISSVIFSADSPVAEGVQNSYVISSVNTLVQNI